ncbi:hypothetical protein D3C77_532440 [compost metagenome]
MTVYDKAKYHYNGDFPEELSHDQAYVHIGFFLGWLIERNLCSTEFLNKYTEHIAAFKARDLLCSQLCKKTAGVLASDMLNEEGNAFAEKGYESYVSDYLYFVDHEDAESTYDVEDNWEHYEMVRDELDISYEMWCERRQG